MIDPELIDKIEGALGHELQEWQKLYLIGIYDKGSKLIYPRHYGRVAGRTLVVMIKLLLDDSVKEFTIEGMPDRISDYYKDYILELNNKLTSVGLKTNLKEKEN